MRRKRWRDEIHTAQLSQLNRRCDDGRPVCDLKCVERPLLGIEGAKTRNYVFANDGVWKIPKRMLGSMVFPQYAGTKQKMLDVFLGEKAARSKSTLAQL